jgi:uncharacterized protein YqeY
MPQQLSQQELAGEIEAIVAEVGAQGPQDMGKVMGVASKKLAGKADGRAISEEVKRALGKGK